MVACIRYIDIAVAVHGYTVGGLELSVAIASAAPSGHKNTVAVELLDAMVACIRYIDIAAVVHGHTEGVLELTVTTTLTAPLTMIIRGFFERERQEQRASAHHQQNYERNGSCQKDNRIALFHTEPTFGTTKI